MNPRIKAQETGPGVYRFLIGSALLECQRNLHDDERFATSVEWVLALSEDIIQKHQKWWRSAMVKILLDDGGKPLVDEQGRWLRPDVEIPKPSQYKRVAALSVLLRKTGIMAKAPEHYEEATGFFEEVLENRGQAPSDKKDPDDEEDDDDE